MSHIILRRIWPELINISKAPGSARIGLPLYEWWNEALHGVARSRGVSFAGAGTPFSSATQFACPIVLSAAFDDDSIEHISTLISNEFRAFSNTGRAGLNVWTPHLNPVRDPRWGRAVETPGEDPFRIAQYTKRVLLGFEGGVDPPIRKTIATCKHLAGYDLDRWNNITRYDFDARISSQELVEYHLPPFQQCARDSHVGSFMCSYNRLNGVPACADTYLLDTVLREHWGWTNDNQYVAGDCNATEKMYIGHHFVETPAQAAAITFNGGCDVACETRERTTDVQGAYDQGLLSEEVLDRSLQRQYHGLIRTGYFDPGANATAYRQLSWKDVNTPEAQQLARSSAAKGLVLLKNDGILPLDTKKNSKIGLVGMWANATIQMLGNYYGTAPYYRSPLWAAQNLGLNVTYAPGPLAQDVLTQNWTDAALEAAQGTDVILFFGGIDITVEGEDRDREDIGWPKAQLALLEKLSALSKPIIVVRHGTSLDDTPLLKNKQIKAILWAGYPGQEGGLAVFDVLTGAVAPAGRLPISQYPADYVNKVPMTDMNLRPSRTNPGRTYKFYNDAVQPFGFGLHYTSFVARFDKKPKARSFRIDTILDQCNEKFLDLCEGPTVGVSVKNDGKITSDFVALVFLSHKNGPKDQHPIKELVGYTRFYAVKPRDTQRAEIKLTLGNLVRVDKKGNKVLYPGDYKLLLDVPTSHSTDFSLTGNKRTLELWPQPPEGRDWE